MIRASNAYEDKRNEIMMTLRHYRSMVKNYQSCKEFLESMFPSGVQTLSDMPRGGQQTFEPERWAIMRINQQERMQADLDKMLDKIEGVRALFNLVDGDWQTVLIRHYGLGETFEEVSEQLDKHRNTIKIWHDKAINKIVRQLY